MGRLANFSDRFKSQLECGEPWWLHFTYLVVDHMGRDIEGEEAHIGELLASVPMRAVSQEVIGNCPNGLRSCLQKLRPHPLPNGYYHLLVEALFDDRRAKLIHHASDVTVDLLDVIRILPDPCLCQRIVGVIKTQSQAEALVYLIDAIQTFVPEHEWDRLWRSTQKISNYKDMKKWFHSWLNDAPFPTPPWEGNAMLRPVRSSKELLRLSRELQNCLRHYVVDCVTGEATFYLWTAGEPVVVCIRRDPFFGWAVERMEGGQNARHVSHTSRTDILEQFAAVGIRKKPPLDSLDFAPFTDNF